MKTHPPILHTPPFSNFVQLPSSLLLPTPTPTALSVILLIWLNGWSHHIWCAILLNDIMDLHMSSHGNLVPERPKCVFYALRHRVYWGLTHNMVLWFDIMRTNTYTHTHKDTLQTQGPVDWYTISIHVYTTCYMLTAAIFITMNEKFTDIKNLLFAMSFLFKIIYL